MPPCRSPSLDGSTSRRCSTYESVVITDLFGLCSPDALLGFPTEPRIIRYPCPFHMEGFPNFVGPSTRWPCMDRSLSRVRAPTAMFDHRHDASDASRSTCSTYFLICLVQTVVPSIRRESRTLAALCSHCDASMPQMLRFRCSSAPIPSLTSGGSAVLPSDPGPVTARTLWARHPSRVVPL